MYIDLLQIQRFSFLKFLKNGINQVFDNINPIIIANRKYIFFSKYYLLKIPSQIDFISINNQFQPLEVVDEPSNSFSSHSIFNILSSNQSEITSSKIKSDPSSSRQWPHPEGGLNFEPPMSSAKYAQWFKMDSTVNLHQGNSKKPLTHYNKIGLFQAQTAHEAVMDSWAFGHVFFGPPPPQGRQLDAPPFRFKGRNLAGRNRDASVFSNKFENTEADTIPIYSNFSSGFFCLGILGWRDPQYFKKQWFYPGSVKTNYEFRPPPPAGREKTQFSPIIKTKLDAYTKSVNIITKKNKSQGSGPIPRGLKNSVLKSSYFKISSISVYKNTLKFIQSWPTFSFNQAPNVSLYAKRWGGTQHLFPGRSNFLIQASVFWYPKPERNALTQYFFHNPNGYSSKEIPQDLSDQAKPWHKSWWVRITSFIAHNQNNKKTVASPRGGIKKNKNFFFNRLDKQPSAGHKKSLAGRNYPTMPKKIMPASNFKNFFFSPRVNKACFFNTDASFVYPLDPIRIQRINKRGQNHTHLFEGDFKRPRFEKDKWPVLKKNLDISSTNLNFSDLKQIRGTSHLTYSSEFYIPVQIIDVISKKMYLRWLLLADLPIQTKRGHFIINGYPKTVIHQIVRSPGIRFKNEDNQILADIISMRGAWMGIQIVYEKNVKAATIGLKSQNRGIINKSMLQSNSSKNLTSIHETTRRNNSQNQNTKSNLPKNFRGPPPQLSRNQYQASFIQNAIIKSEKINYLPSPRLNLLEAKHENKTLEKLKHWPETFFNYQPINSSAPAGRQWPISNQNLTHLEKQKDRSIQKIFEKPPASATVGSVIPAGEEKNPAGRHQFGSTKYYFWDCPFWSAIRC